MDFLKGFFSKSSDSSMTRSCCFICVLTACILAIIGRDVIIVGNLLGAGFTAKVTQKIKE